MLKELKYLIEELWESVKMDVYFFSDIGKSVRELSETDFTHLDKKATAALHLQVKEVDHFLSDRIKNKHESSEESVPEQVILNASRVADMLIICESLSEMTDKEIERERKKFVAGESKKSAKTAKKVFIGYESSDLWKKVQTFLKKDMGLRSSTFCFIGMPDYSAVQKLKKALKDADFAVLLLSSDDKLIQGSDQLTGRYAVQGLGVLQGKLGFDNVVVLQQHGTRNISDLIRLHRIRFEGQDIEQTFDKLEKILERRGTSL